MNFIELSKARYSVRNFSDKPVSTDDLNLILEAGRLAPTAVNAQPQRIFVLKSKDAIEKIRKVTAMAYNAPIVLLVCYDKNVSWKAKKYGDDYDAGGMDASIVASAMMMQATELNIGTLWARAFNSQLIMDEFQLPENIVPVCLIDVGYPREECSPSARHFERLPISDTVTEL